MSARSRRRKQLRERRFASGPLSAADAWHHAIRALQVSAAVREGDSLRQHRESHAAVERFLQPLTDRQVRDVAVALALLPRFCRVKGELTDQAQLEDLALGFGWVFSDG